MPGSRDDPRTFHQYLRHVRRRRIADIRRTSDTPGQNPAEASIAQAEPAIGQTNIQRQLREDAAQPDVWIDISPTIGVTGYSIALSTDPFPQ